MGRIKVALIGVGNCASSLIQGIHFYRNATENDTVPGVMNTVVGGYHIGDIDVVTAFDVDKNKVGCDLAEAIFVNPNNAAHLVDVPVTGIKVQRGKTLDGIGEYSSEIIHESNAHEDDVADALLEKQVDVVVNYLPVGAEEATAWYAEKALEASCGFVNCIPIPIASVNHWRKRFEEKNLAVVGDDVKSQCGATIIHRLLAGLYRDRGIRLDRTYQLNYGGNMDFRNMLDRSRISLKVRSKTDSVTSQFNQKLPPSSVHIGPSDYVPWLEDRKVAYIRLEGTAFGEVPHNIELRLEVHDSPNSAGVVVDAIRCIKLARDQGECGALEGPSAFFMKSPPVQLREDQAFEMTKQYMYRHENYDASDNARSG